MLFNPPKNAGFLRAINLIFNLWPLYMFIFIFVVCPIVRRLTINLTQITRSVIQQPSDDIEVFFFSHQEKLRCVGRVGNLHLKVK